MTSIIKVDQIQTAAGGVPTAADLGLNVSGSVLQVKQTVVDSNLGPYTTSSWADLSELSVTLTPKAADSQFLIMANVHYFQGSSGTDDFAFNLRTVRNGSPLSYTVNSNHGYGDYAVYKVNFDSLMGETATFHRIDSPSTISDVTYSLQITTGFGGWSSNPVYINRSSRFDDAWYATSNARSTLTVMEIAG